MQPDTVSAVTYATYEDLAAKLEHVSGQLDVLNHSLYVSNSQLSYITVSVMLLAALAMFFIGFTITKGRK